jgi:hypothetical protein
MKLKRKTRLNVLKIAGVLLSTFIIYVIMTGMNETYSWFTNNVSAHITASVAKPEDIIKSVIVKYPEAPANPAKIQTPAKLIITKAQSCNSDPTVYFELTGRLLYYIQHVNPIELSDKNKSYQDSEGNNVYEVPLYVKINSNEKAFLSDSITGEIYIRYLNDYIKVPAYIPNNSEENKYKLEYKASDLKDAMAYDRSYNDINTVNPGMNISFIKEIKVNIEENPDKIFITRLKDASSDAIVYFELTGKLPYFIQYINPIRLGEDNKSYEDSEGNYVYEIPIHLKVNMLEITRQEYINISAVEGQVVIRNLNYYGEAINLKYTKAYLFTLRYANSFDPYLKK